MYPSIWNQAPTSLWLGEGEITMQELLSAFREKRSGALEKVNGIAYLDARGEPPPDGTTCADSGS